MKVNKTLYKNYTKKHAPKSRLIKNCILSFVVGGSICTLGQAIFSLYSGFIKDPNAISSAVSVSLIFLSCFFTAIGWYDRLAKHAGAGTLVPITGFANATISPALDTRAEGFITGVGTKLFTVAGPVIVYGTVASVLYGILYYLFLR